MSNELLKLAPFKPEFDSSSILSAIPNELAEKKKYAGIERIVAY